MSNKLSQDEISALIRGLEDGLIASEETTEHSGIRRYDLGSEEKIVRGRLPGMELLYERFSREARSTLRSFLKHPCALSGSGIQIEKFGTLMKKLPVPSSLHLFRLPPLTGQAMLALSPELAYGLVDLLFGGTGKPFSSKNSREFSAIEARLLGKSVAVLLDAVRDAWAPLHPVDAIYARSEMNPMAASIAASTDNCVAAAFDLEVEKLSGGFQIIVPYQMLEPIRQKLNVGFQAAAQERAPDTEKRLLKNLIKASATVSVEVARGKIPAEKVLAMKVGDVLQLDTPADEPALIKVEGRPKFIGLAGKSRGSKAVTVQSLFSDSKLRSRK